MSSMRCAEPPPGSITGHENRSDTADLPLPVTRQPLQQPAMWDGATLFGCW